MAALLKRLYLGEEGQGLVEYSLILALIAAMCFVAVREFGVMVKGLYEKVTF
ncbi:MAG TPA: Flp family type IVb pilin [Syntrophomonadaceae bacterium]|nr:Flp family type IVb pilin [Syntrophomonadaceae bacterium]